MALTLRSQWSVYYRENSPNEGYLPDAKQQCSAQKLKVYLHSPPHIINRVVYSFFRQSKAERSYIYSMEIQQHGFDTPLFHPSGNGQFRRHHNNKCNSYVREDHLEIVRS